MTVFVIGLIIAVFSTWKLWFNQRDDYAARTEYAYLRELNAGIITTTMLPQLPALQDEQRLRRTILVEGIRQIQTDPNPDSDLDSDLDSVPNFSPDPTTICALILRWLH